MKINNRSDFELRICVREAITQKVVELPKERFRIELYIKEGVSWAPRIILWSDDANVHRADDNLYLIAAVHVCEGSYLPNGTLMCRLYIDQPNTLYLDGFRHLQRPINTGVTIWDGDSDVLLNSVDVEILTTYYKGEPGVGVPKGGAPGQVLIKSSAADYATAWSNPTAGGGGITPEEPDEALDSRAVRFDKEQSLTTQQQLQALENAGVVVMRFAASDLGRKLTDEEFERAMLCDFIRVDGTAHDTIWLARGTHSGGAVLFTQQLNDNAYFYLLVKESTRTISHILVGQFTDLNAVKTTTSPLDPARARNVRTNIASVGYLQLAASLGAESDNYPLTLTTPLAGVQAAYALFWAAPGRYRWSLTINQPSELNPFVEEAELEPLQVNGGLELLFTSKRSSRRYALVLTVEDFAVTAARVEYRMRPELRGCVQAGAAFNTQTGYWEYHDILDLTDEQVSEMYTKWIRSGGMNFAYYNDKTLRATFAPLAGGYSTRAEIYCTFYGCSNIEVAVISTNVANAADCFGLCHKLRAVYGSGISGGKPVSYVDATALTGYFALSMLGGCPVLERVYLMNVKANFNIGSTRLEIECVDYMIQHAANTAPITLTFHPTLYARIPDELKASAAAKNISIASA